MSNNLTQQTSCVILLHTNFLCVIILHTVTNILAYAVIPFATATVGHDLWHIQAVTAGINHST